MMHVVYGENAGSVATSVILAVALVMSFGIRAQAITSELPEISASNGAMIAREIEPELQIFVNQQKRLPQQARQVLVKVTPDPATGVIWIDLDANYLPKNTNYFTEDFGQLVREVENEGYELLSGIVQFRYIKVRIGGRELREIYPPGYLKRRGSGSGSAASPVEGRLSLSRE
jgi:biopolymer transport protein ExbD